MTNKTKARMNDEARMQQALTLADEIHNLVMRFPPGIFVEFQLTAANGIGTRRGTLRIEKGLMSFRPDDDDVVN